MLNRRRETAQKIADQLFAAEAAIDAAIAATAQLAAMMPLARQDARVSALIGQDALVRAAETCTALVAARGSIVETHKALTVAQHDMGLGAVAFGGLVEKPPVRAPFAEGRTAPRLTAVTRTEAA